MIEICTVLFHDPQMLHANYLSSTMFTGLALPSNVPQLLRIEQVIHNIYCSKQDEAHIISEYGRVARTIGLDFKIYPIVRTFENLMHGIRDQINRSMQNGSKIIFSSADWIWSNGMADSVMALKKGECRVCGTLRINASQIGYVKDFISMPHENAEYSKLFIDVIPHNLVQLGKQKPWIYEHLEKRDYGWEFFHQEPAPVMFWPLSGDGALSCMEGEYIPLPVFDHQFTQNLFMEGRIVCGGSNREVFVGEFTGDQTYPNMIENGYECEAARHFRNFGVKHYY